MKFQQFLQTRTGGYTIAVASVTVAILLRYIFSDLLAERANYLFYFVAILIAAAVGGLRPGLLAVGLAVVASVSIFWPASGSFQSLLDEGLRTALFALVGIAICAGYDSMHRARAALEAEVNHHRLTGAKLSEEIERRSTSEEEMRVQRDWLETTLTSIGDATIVTDAAGKVVLMNPIAVRLTGHKPDEAQGQRLETIFRIINQRTRAPVENPVVRVIQSGHIQGLANHTLLIDKLGGERPIEDSAAPIFDRNGKVSGVVLVFRDVTARKKAEAEMERLLFELREADRLKDEFLALLAHELRNPLAPIRSAIDVVRMGDKQSVANACDILQRQVVNMARLVDDLLQVSRITHNQLEMRKIHTDLAPILRQALEMSRPLIEAKSHALTEEIPSEPMPIEGDVTRLAQLFSNLLNNAVKFTDPGGQIFLSVERHPEHVIVSVRDNGMGIPRGMEEKIFQLFSQLETGISRSQGGLGIGLTLVQRIAHMHGGAVRVARTTEPGTTFLVQLPLSKRPTLKAEQPPTQLADMPGSLALRVLVVDDNHDAAESLAVLLNILGSHVKVCHDGIEAVEAVQEFQPDAILLDIGLPRLDGYGAAVQIRQQPGGGDITLIALSGYGREDDRQRSKEAGFDHHLVKPVAPDMLINILTPIVGRQTEPGSVAS